MATFTALLDACVLYPAPLRDLLVSFAVAGMYRARWTEQIHEEWISAVLAQRPDLKRDTLIRTKTLMNTAVFGSVVTGYEPLIDGLVLPDANDRHVLAAAIKTRANVIVTFNLTDFPVDRLDPFGIEPQHPDDFVISQFEISPPIACAAIKALRSRLKNPAKSDDDYIETLAAQRLPQTVERLREYKSLI